MIVCSLNAIVTANICNILIVFNELFALFERNETLFMEIRCKDKLNMHAQARRYGAHHEIAFCNPVKIYLNLLKIW